MKQNKLLQFVDPYKQSVFYFKTDFFTWFMFLVACIILAINLKNIFVLCLLLNPLFAYPNVYIHSLFGHFLLGKILAGLFAGTFGFILPGTVTQTVCQLLEAAAGSFSEMILPTIAILVCLRMGGGRYVLPIALYWFSVSLCSMGMYMVAPSTQIDLFAYGPSGDWAFIFDTLGLAGLESIIGAGVIFLAIACFVLAVWSPFYYWRHMEQYPIPYSEFW